MGRKHRHRSSGSSTRRIDGTLYWRPLPNPPGVGETAVQSHHDHLTSFRTLDDFVGAPDMFNPCTHRRFRFVRTAWPEGWTDFNHVRLSSPYPIKLDLLDWQRIYPTNWLRGSNQYNEFCSDAFTHMTTQVPPSFDGLYVLQDVLSVRRLARSCMNLVWRLLQFARDFVSQLGSNFRGFGMGRNLRDMSKIVADAHLTTVFGIQPLIREFEELGAGLIGLRARLKFLQDTYGEVFTTHYRRIYPANFQPEFQWGGQSYCYYAEGAAGAEQWWIAKPISGKTSYSAQLSLQNNLRGLSGMRAEINNFLAAIGVGNIATFAWDLVPFSFVGDWILPVNKWLDRYASIDPFRGNLQVVGSGHSIKSSASWDIIFHPAPMYGNQPQKIGKLTFSEYYRILGLPSAFCWGDLISGGLSDQQLAILTSLATQRVRGV